MTRLRTTGLELAAFAALAWYAAAHWAHGLVADAPDARILACVLIATAVGAALALAGVLRAVPGLALRWTCVTAGFGAGSVAVGLDRRLLAPGNWNELFDGLDRGFATLGAVQWPYDGPEPWAALAILLAVPFVLTVAATLAFWPRRRSRALSFALLVALYAVPATEREFGGELGRGALLLLLTAAWLWLPRLSERSWRAVAVAGATVLVAGGLALPAAARYEDDRPWIDYESWNPFAARAAARFDWSHSYGPIEWPRDGTTLMNVRSADRHYWKVETLDRFDGFRWLRSRQGRGDLPLLPRPYREEWETRVRVAIRELDTSLFPIAGTALRITGADPVAVPSADGTVEAAAESLDEGESYTVDAFVPNPTPEQMRAAPAPPRRGGDGLPAPIRPYTRISLPPPGTTALDGSGDATASGHLSATVADIRRSPYADVLRLARRLASRQPTSYDVVLAIQRHLRSEYSYNERPPRRPFPLAAFLFEDRIGYCQQFSGAMALMLRMLGIPTRVAAGFSPGSYNRDTREYRVRDLDAHSWVEVWFSGVGWVPFDPTPAIAPAESQSSADAASASGGVAGAGETPDALGARPRPSDSDPEGGSGALRSEGDSAVELWVPLAAVAVLALGWLALLRLRVLLLRRAAPAPDEPEIVSLRWALARIGEDASPRLTLRQLEARLRRTAGPRAARYLETLRERRFSGRPSARPDGGSRRDLRRALARGKGLRAHAVAIAALPPIPFRRD